MTKDWTVWMERGQGTLVLKAAKEGTKGAVIVEAPDFLAIAFIDRERNIDALKAQLAAARADAETLATALKELHDENDCSSDVSECEILLALANHENLKAGEGKVTEQTLIEGDIPLDVRRHV